MGINEYEKNVDKFKGWIDVLSETDKSKIENNKATSFAKVFLKTEDKLKLMSKEKKN